MGQAVNGVSYERTNPSNCCTRSDAGRRSTNCPGCGIRQDASPASPVGRRGREIARSGIRLDGRLLEVGPWAQGQTSRVRMGAGQVETRAANRCSLGFPKVARQPWWLHIRCMPLALMRAVLAPAVAPSLFCRFSSFRRMTSLLIWEYRRDTDYNITPIPPQPCTRTLLNPTPI